MKSKCYLATGVSVLALAGTACLCANAQASLRHGQLIPFGALGHVGPFQPPYVAPKKSKSGTWKDLSGKLPFKGGPDTMLLLTDGTVLEHDACTSNWYRLTPDDKGQYQDGTWSSIAAMPTGYGPIYFASQILTDGRLIMNGGEYNTPCEGGVWTNLGAIYDPVANSWTSVKAPSGWSSIGDAQSEVLPDGSYMLADCCDTSGAIASISGTTVTWTSTGTDKGDENDEEAWTPLPDGDLLTVDVWNIGTDYDDYEIYDTSKGTWSSPGRTPDLLTTTQYHELGAAALTPSYGKSGTIIQFSANSSKGINDIYSASAGTWSSGPVMMVGSTIYDCADAPAATLPDGNVIVQASPGTYNTPSHFWEFSISSKGAVTATQVSDPKSAPADSSYFGRFLELPTGQLMWANSGESQGVTAEVATYSPKGKAKPAWLPAVSSVASTLTVGSTGNAISGKNFNGFSLGAVYGDDAQEPTNYPIVRITNKSSGDVCFGRSYDFSTMGVWTTGTTNAVFDLPKSCPTGAGMLQVIVNGIASKAVTVTLKS